MRWLERLIPPPLAALIAAAAMSGAARELRPFDIGQGTRLAAALTISALGVALAGAGVLAFRRAGASIDPHRIDKGRVLVTGGVYRITRNPMYLGLTLVLCGYAAYLARPEEFLGPLAFAAYTTRFQIRPEEEAMRAKFGADYEAYLRATRRWL